ncbi:hypothetical protein PInf_007039 [Phytophthora infestans]|nr:hypothetical protein PInf_007039 [Phytophthora infestans]
MLSLVEALTVGLKASGVEAALKSKKTASVQPAPEPEPKVEQDVYEYVQNMATHMQNVGMSEYDRHRYAHKQKLLSVVESVAESGASRLNINH